MGALLDKYKNLKKRVKSSNIVGVADDISKIAYDVTKDDPKSQALRRKIRRG